MIGPFLVHELLEQQARSIGASPTDAELEHAVGVVMIKRNPRRSDGQSEFDDIARGFDAVVLRDGLRSTEHARDEHAEGSASRRAVHRPTTASEAAVIANWLVICVASRRNWERSNGRKSRGTTIVAPGGTTFELPKVSQL